MITKRARRTILLGLTAATLVVGGCGLEGLFNQYAGSDYTQPVTTIGGTVAMPSPELTVLDVNGEEIEPFEVRLGDGTYEIDLISGTYAGLRLRATQGQGILETFVPEVAAESAVSGVDLTVESTATVKIVEGLLGPSGKTLPNLSDDLVCIMGKKVRAQAAGAGPVAEVVRIMERIFGRAKLDLTTETRVFQSAEVAEDYTVIESALNPNWVSRANFDYDDDGVLNQTTEVFDLLFVEALQALELSAPPDPALVRVVFSVDFNEGKLSGACGKINRFKWVRDEPNKSMFFVGGIHQSSPVQDPEIDAMLGNRGGWTPNQIHMYDDGTHGDRTGGDNIWSLYFDLPRGTRVGFKYTWGNQGDLWTGTEEWPGNQRILEVVDVNEDGYVYRFDDFGDEASNKDLANLHPAAGGTLEWDEDVNGDGYAEARETPLDLDNDCVTDEFVTPDWVPALTVSCEEFEAE